MSLVTGVILCSSHIHLGGGKFVIIHILLSLVQRRSDCRRRGMGQCREGHRPFRSDGTSISDPSLIQMTAVAEYPPLRMKLARLTL